MYNSILLWRNRYEYRSPGPQGSPTGRRRRGRRSSGLRRKRTRRKCPGRRGLPHRSRALGWRNLPHPGPRRRLRDVRGGCEAFSVAARDQQDPDNRRHRIRDHYGIPGRSPPLHRQRLVLLPHHRNRRRRNEDHYRRWGRRPLRRRLTPERHDRPRRPAVLQCPGPSGVPQRLPRRTVGDNGDPHPPRHCPP